MKRFNSIMMLVATLAAVSCAKNNQTDGLFTYKAQCPGVEDGAKTYLQNGKNVVWAANDAINVLTASNNEKFTLTDGASSTEGTFSGNPVTGDAYAVYPYNSSATYAGGVITTTLTATQNARADGFGTNINLAVAKEDKGTFAFKNVCGLIKFQIKGDNIGKVVITGNNGEDLAGKVSISFNEQGEPVYEVVEGSKSVTIQTHNGAVMAPGTYYAAVLPQTFTKGITITCEPYKFSATAPVKQVSIPTNTLKKTGSSALELSRSSVKPVGYVDAGLAWANGKTGAPVRLAGLRGTDKSHGLYLDFSTGRCFYAIGAYQYCGNCDLLMVTNASSGFAPCAPGSAGGLTNATNIGKFGDDYTDDDYTNNWTTKLSPKFCYVGGQELADEQFEAITTVEQIKAIYDAHIGDVVSTYYTSSDFVTNANRGRMTVAGDTDTHKFLVIKTYSSTEGTGYGIIKFVGLAGGTWYIELFYKWGLEVPAK